MNRILQITVNVAEDELREFVYERLCAIEPLEHRKSALVSFFNNLNGDVNSLSSEEIARVLNEIHNYRLTLKTVDSQLEDIQRTLAQYLEILSDDEKREDLGVTGSLG